MPGENGNDDNGQGNGGGTPPLAAGEGGGRTFTQAEVDALVGKTRQEARERATKDFADYEDLKKAAEELGKLKEADLSEQEKLKKRIADMELALADREAQAQAQAIEVNERLVRAEVRMIAATMNFIKPEQAYKLADLTDVETDEDGQIKGVKKALERLAKDSPHLIEAAGGPGSPPNQPKKGKADLEALVDAAAMKYGTRVPPKT